MINRLLHACAVPLDPGQAGHGSGQWCPTCHRWQVNTFPMVPHPPPAAAAAEGADMNLPDVIISNTPPSTPIHNIRFFPADEPWPAHTAVPAHLPAPAAPRRYLDLPRVCLDALFPLKVQGGASGAAEDTCLTWTQVGRELRQMADNFHLRPRVDPEEHHQQDVDAAAATALTTATTIAAKGFCVSLLCLVSWKILTRLKEEIQI